jgi:hypothetical protein
MILLSPTGFSVRAVDSWALKTFSPEWGIGGQELVLDGGSRVAVDGVSLSWSWVGRLVLSLQHG